MMANPRIKTYKALSALLTYPTAELQQAAAEIRDVIAAEGIVPARDRAALDTLIEDIGTRDLYDLQERYTMLFDRSRSLSLHLFEHVHGESRDRGQAMLDLAQLYERHGYHVAANELPDYLPMFLEFLSRLPADEARDMLDEAAHILAALDERLKKRKSVYANVFRALRALARGKLSPAQLPELAGDDDVSADDLEALDAEWEETAVTFGPGDPMDGACGTPRLATRLRAAARSVVGQGTN
jgi:nitrate reductase molybdenum cofactor assembly chaperone NarJ/NarW